MTRTHTQAARQHAMLLEQRSGAAAPADARADGFAEKGRAPLVWVVDDDPVVCLYLDELLTTQGYDVVMFSDPRRALGAFLSDSREVDAVVTDRRMPSLCGDSLAGEMLSLRPDVRIILRTGYEDATSDAKAFGLGIRHVFHKPFDSRALLRASARPCAHFGSSLAPGALLAPARSRKRCLAAADCISSFPASPGCPPLPF